MKAVRILFRHGEKAFLVAACVLCALMLHQTVQELRRNSAVDRALEKRLKDAADALHRSSPAKTGYRYARPLPLIPDVRGNLNIAGPRWAMFHGAFYAPKLKDKIIREPGPALENGRLSAAKELAVSAEQGLVRIAWRQSETNELVRVIEYRVFRRIGKADAPENVPWRVVSAGDDNYAILDKDVRPKQTYTYWVQAVGVRVPQDGVEIIRPAEISTERADGVERWLSLLTGPRSAMVPSDVHVVYRGRAGDVEPRGIFEIQIWDHKFGGWLSHTVYVAESQRIAGKKLVRTEGIQHRRSFDGRIRLIELATKTVTISTTVTVPVQLPDGSFEYTERRIDRKKTVPFARVLDLDTGDEVRLPLVRRK